MDRGGGQELALSAWNPERQLRQVDPRAVRYSRGFLRCRPERWFPGFAMQWLPLGHSLGVEFKLMSAKPVITVPPDLEYRFGGTVDGETVGVAFGAETAEAVLEAVAPSSRPVAKGIVLEYLARRLLTSLAMSWSGPESAAFQFDAEGGAEVSDLTAAVKLTAGVGGVPATFWILLGPTVVDKMDGLWRRHLQSSARQNVAPADVRIEVAYLTVPPAMLSDYLTPGTTVDLETPVCDRVVLSSGGQSWLSARLGAAGGRFVLEILPIAPPTFALPSGTTRLAVELGAIHLDSAAARELSQPGAMVDTGIDLADRVGLTVNGERVAEALLRTYQGRFVVSVL